MDRMGELRSALHERPSKESWERITRLLDRWPGREELLEVALPYAYSVCQGWEYIDVLDAWDHLDAPESWKRALLGVGKTKGMGARRVQLASLAPMLMLDFRGVADAPVELEPMARPMLCASIYLKEVRNVALASICAQIELPALRHLNLYEEGGRLRGSGLQALLDRLEPGALVSVELTMARLDATSARVLASHPALSQLMDLDLDEESFASLDAVRALNNSEVIPANTLRSLRGAAQRSRLQAFVAPPRAVLYEEDYE